ncbi:MAG: hypothetical protein KKE39_02425 [Bacteroidetes bacterium]|nr:hypothetical protein [Bacteroidota bacterium]MBU1372574.1 hypothetical protein [Bacteroidota bacterium]MBU1485017.1 hypothetical protein [Bacteroidota bacterium]MBU1760338.1 hypothetical protein [Bacteroidota bacterium]MBU2046604.1 hypothetical protein [Bacteroidota bacterium]
METKLTLKLNKSIIEDAKKYAKVKNTSLSKMIETYLKTVTKSPKQEIEISPLVKSLTGIINLDEVDYKESHINHLEKKYS